MIVNQIDHLLIILIAIVYPIYTTIIWYRRDHPKLVAGKTYALVHFYRNSIIELWLLTLVILTWWFWAERTLSGIGLGLPSGWTFWIGVIVFVVVAVFLGQQIKTVRSSAEARAQLQKQLTGSTSLLVPRNDIERKYAIVTSFTAGICEEVLYRGFIIWYLMNWIPDYGAVIVSAILFGIVHIYQGVVGAIKSLAMGLILALAYLLTGTLWIPIALHATVDVASLLTSSFALSTEETVKENKED